ncbi:MAG: glycosyltransferase [Cyclobacteriaceae bacterium]
MPEQTNTKAKRLTKTQASGALLMEIAWEVLNQVGGIYTVIRSKVPTMIPKWEENYCLIGPYMPNNAGAEFEPMELGSDHYSNAVKRMRDMGYTVHYGAWLVSGRPKAILFDLGSVMHRLGDIKYALWQDHNIPTPGDDHLLNDVLAFGEMVKMYLTELAAENNGEKKILAHFHEWMAASGLPALRRDRVDVRTIFTTHATLLGRYLAMNDPQFYDHLDFMDWQKEAKHFNIESNVMLERAAAHGSHVFTTVSEVTAKECRQLLGRNPDVILPNGINNQRFEALHEFQNLHLENKNKIHSFTMTHFFSNYTFDLDKTLYFFTSGRYEYLNKGYDLTLEALARLNHRLQTEGSDTTVVMFFITKRPYYSINPEILESRALLEEFKQVIDSIKKQVGDKLLFDAFNRSDAKLPLLNDFVDDYWRLRFRRTLQTWKSNTLPPVITHNLHDDSSDEILNFLRTSNMVNNEHDRVKIVYHPDFINYTNPLFGMDYGQFVRGCHLGVFPSYYEPWGYTPLECIASGVPTVTSDLAGFGDYVKDNVPDHDKRGIYLVKRNQKSFDEAAGNLANKMYNYVRLNRRDRIELRNRTESSSSLFDWSNLVKHYDEAYYKAFSI